MNWAKRLFGVLKLGRQTPAIKRFQGESGENRTRSILLRSPLVAGDEAVADALLSSGDVVPFDMGDDIIVQGDLDDDSVFFLLFGDANVYVNGILRKDVNRSAPVSVGEMAAKDPTQKRSATIRVASDQLVALKVPGPILRNLSQTNQSFRERLWEDIEGRGRQAIAATGVSPKMNRLVWAAISFLVGLFVGAVLWWALSSNGVPLLVSITVSVYIGLSAFGFVLLSDPSFRYFRLGSLCVGALLVNEVLKWNVQGSIIGIEFSYQLSDAKQACQASDFVAPLILAALSAYLFWIDTKVR